MFCPKCGKEVEDDAVVCVHCGRPLEMNYHHEHHNHNRVNPEYDQPKTVIGVLMALFLGVIGLLVGVLMYPEGTVARKTFMKSWIITFVIVTAIGIIGSVVFSILSFTLFESMYESMPDMLIRF